MYSLNDDDDKLTSIGHFLKDLNLIGVTPIPEKWSVEEENINKKNLEKGIFFDLNINKLCKKVDYENKININNHISKILNKNDKNNKLVKTKDSFQGINLHNILKTNKNLLNNFDLQNLDITALNDLKTSIFNSLGENSKNIPDIDISKIMEIMKLLKETNFKKYLKGDNYDSEFENLYNSTEFKNIMYTLFKINYKKN